MNYASSHPKTSPHRLTVTDGPNGVGCRGEVVASLHEELAGARNPTLLSCPNGDIPALFYSNRAKPTGRPEQTTVGECEDDGEGLGNCSALPSPAAS